MKILSARQIREIDAKTIHYEGISSLELMKRAAGAFYDWFIKKYTDKNSAILILSGVGNNGGDGLMVARLLHKAGYRVQACVVEYSENYSEDCAHNVRRVKAENVPFKRITKEKEIPNFSEYEILIDALFGTGLSREITGIAAEVIKKMNESGKTIVSIDIPSGLFLDKKTTFAVEADETVTFQIPKLALYLPDNYRFVGNVTIVNIGLSEKAIEEASTNRFLIEKKDIRELLKPLSKFAHKGTQGHALIIGGSLGKSGSVCLASKAALKTGCGLVTAYLPKCATPVIQTYIPEAMAIEDNNNAFITDIDYDINPHAIGIGVGMGKREETQQAFYRFLQRNPVPMVIDADGLNMLSLHPEWFDLLPPKTILTPHPKELSRLIGEWCDDYEKIDKATAFAQKHQLIVIIKGAYSLIIDSENLYVNDSGTPALATAGSGDVLTGMIASLLAQGYEPVHAAKTGVYLHGLTANLTQQTIHPRSFVASDIIDNIGNAYFCIENGMIKK
jgi:hydroxyethylthiazole kinase-like uncharacterized protein yjeF